MARKKRRAAKGGVKAGARVAPVAGRTAGKAAWKLGKAEAKLIRRAMSSQEPKKSRYLKYGFFVLLGLAIGAAIARSKKGETSGESSSYTGTTGPHAPDPGSLQDSGARPGVVAPRQGQLAAVANRVLAVPTAPVPSESIRTPRPDL